MHVLNWYVLLEPILFEFWCEKLLYDIMFVFHVAPGSTVKILKYILKYERHGNYHRLCAEDFSKY